MQAEGKATAKIIHTAHDLAASYALDLTVKATAEPIEERIVKTRGKVPEYAVETARKTLKFLNQRGGIELAIENNIPLKAGLGEVEATSVATALAVAGAVARRYGAVNELKIDVYNTHQFMVVENKLINKIKLLDLCSGEYDRLFSSLYGGFCVCDNRRKQVLRRGEMESMTYIAAIPPKKPRIDGDLLNLFRHEVDLIFNECLKGNLYSAMRLSSLLFQDKTAVKMLSAGATIAGTSFPSTLALIKNNRKTGEVIKAAKGNKVIMGCLGNTESRILTKPKRIVKVNEFLKLKGGQEYYYL